jgi:uncharacterized membrane protein
MNCFKIVLSAVASLLIAEVLLSPAFRGLSSDKATGLSAIVGGFYAALLSPLFWISAVLLFLLFSVPAVSVTWRFASCSSGHRQS